MAETALRAPRRAGELTVAVLASVVAAGIAGAISGFVWGGLGGRVVMRILFLTSDERVRGMTSDDGFEIGRISADTIFLVIAMTVLGGILGSFYGIARHCFDGSTTRARAGISIAVGLFSGAAIVHTDGVDFRFLDPLFLSVGFFVALPAIWVLSLVSMTERGLHWARLGSIPRIDERPLGLAGVAIAWAVIALMSVVGLLDIISDVSDLA